ncbi:MAG TPA: TonB-dependent receptor [Myxococcaceae bacterium]|nr:TonB-dependent receptor [Myxococcaceae bacterium]
MFHALALAALLTASEPSRDESPDAGSRPDLMVVSGSVWTPELRTIADVVVSITGPSMAGEVVVVTNEFGDFRASIPPGVVTLRFEKEGFRPYVRTGLDLSSGKDARLAITLIPEDPGLETISICRCGPPMVDVGIAEEGGTASLSSLAAVPLAPPFAPGGVSRSFDTLLRVFPGMRAGLEGSRNGVDPSRELGVWVDGISVREPVVGLLAVPVTSHLINEASAVTAAPNATHGGSTSAWLAASTLSGGNELHGRVFTTVTPSALDSASTTLGDVGAGLGGYLVKDRLWFAAGGQWPWAAPASVAPGAQGLLRLTTLISPDARVEARYVDAGARLLEHAVRSRLAAVSGNFAAWDRRLIFEVQGWWMGVSDRSGGPGLDLSSQTLGASGTLTALVTAWGHHLLKLGYEGRSSQTGSTSRDVLSAFVDENWAVADRITVLLGARTDVQQLRAGAGEATVSGSLLPRLGLVFDPTQEGLAKIFGWWGRLADDVPLAVLGGAPHPVAFASGLRPPAAEAWSVGTQFAMMPFVGGLRYSERRLTSAIARMEAGDVTTVVNPGQDSAAGVERPSRLERSLTVSVSVPYSDQWVLEASARLERLQANVLSAALIETSPARVPSPVEVWAPELKVAVGHSIVLGPRWRLRLGTAFGLWRALPEMERFAPTSSDLTWTSRVDARVGLEWSDGKGRSADISIEGFDLFDTRTHGAAALDGRSVRLGASLQF